jgi:uncharacterized protein with HEPN domain
MDNKNIQLIQKIIVYAQKILNYCHNVNEEDFITDSKLVEACVFNLIQMGELTRLISDDYMAEHSNIPWHQLRGLRNRIVHNYDGVDLSLIWDIINGDLEELVQKLSEIRVVG